MIVWLNGAFGVGKTTAAQVVCDQAGWRLFDPDQVGSMIAANLSDLEFRDFQDLRPWRRLVPAVAEEIQRYTNTPLVAVQTVLVEDYWAELAADFEQREMPVVHVVLDCGTEELRRRIESDEVEGQAKQWRLDRLAEFGRARDWLTRSADVALDTTQSRPKQSPGR
ncbi:MAG: AAA family ATPase [Actinomycetia bacterium]|nr:AAA family ATPase [Actinomycetes bacterium]